MLSWPVCRRDRRTYAPINVKPLGRGGGGEAGHKRGNCPVVGTFDRFNGLSSNLLLTFSCHFDNPQMPWGGAFEQKLSAQFKCPVYARPPLGILRYYQKFQTMQIRQSCVSLEFLGILGNCTLHRFLSLEFLGMLKNLT